ncbi:MAG: response regulator [Anaerolineales bacterium]|jgi:DNA-binding response OmpR family regulator
MTGGKGYLLIIEDDPDILKLLDKTLTIKGYRVVTASNGYDGLEIIRKERPELVITDIMMPKMDGFNLVHRLRIDPETRTIPVIFITVTYIAREDREFALDIGATRFIQKPIDFEKFLETVTDLLEQREPVTPEPLNESSFYDGYRKRLEAKLSQKTTQIARDKRLMETTSSKEEKQLLQSSIHLVNKECEELKLLLEQIHKQIKKNVNPD